MKQFRSSILLVSIAVLASTVAVAADQPAGTDGEALYKKDCAQCHGAVGEGSKKAPQPLVGERSPAQLVNVIVKTMPDDDPGTYTPEKAKVVAAYLYDAFYSPDARAKRNPPRVEFARLTVRQYKNSIADIIGSFGKVVKADARPGLTAKYFEGRGFGGKPLIDRIDTEINFDFGRNGPDGTKALPLPPLGPPAPAPKSKPADTAAAQTAAASKPAAAPTQTAPPATMVIPVAAPAPPPASVAAPPKTDVKAFDPKQFSISWDGSISPPDSGNYEFVVRSEQAVQLWVNDLNNKRPLIDALVRSGGEEQDLSGTLYLLAGRSYSIRLEIIKGRELDKKKLDDPKVGSRKASAYLLWKPPHGQLEIIPGRYLSPARSTEVLVVSTPFPPDDRSYGWERGTTISKEWHAATTDAALEVAAYLAVRTQSFWGVALDAPDAKTKLRAFAKTFAERAFRRPLTDLEKTQFIDKQFDAAPDAEQALKRVALLVLKSPRFLYPAAMENEAYASASRLSYALWDSPPDQALLDAAAANKLLKREELVAQAERMVATPRARAKLHEFVMTWLRTDRFPELNKDAKRFPGFDAALASDLRKSLELLIDRVLLSDAADFRQLLLSDEMFMNDRLAKFYGAELPGSPTSKKKESGEFTPVKWEADKRAGVLTHPYMLAGLSYPAESSPIHRGVFVVRGLLGVTLLPPPDAVVPLPPDLHPSLTTRERVTLQTKADACVRCHGVINPLGFTLENFDAVGRFREKEHDKPIDVSGSFETRAGEVVPFVGAKPLATLMAGNEQVHAAFAQQLFQYLVKQPVRAFGLTTPQKLQDAFAKSNYNIRKLAVEIAVMAAEKRSNDVTLKP